MIHAMAATGTRHRPPSHALASPLALSACVTAAQASHYTLPPPRPAAAAAAAATAEALGLQPE
jgi:hypothetical protein